LRRDEQRQAIDDQGGGRAYPEQRIEDSKAGISCSANQPNASLEPEATTQASALVCSTIRETRSLSHQQPLLLEQLQRCLNGLGVDPQF